MQKIELSMINTASTGGMAKPTKKHKNNSKIDILDKMMPHKTTLLKAIPIRSNIITTTTIIRISSLLYLEAMAGQEVAQNPDNIKGKILKPSLN